MFEITLKRDGNLKATHCAIYAAKVEETEVKKKDIGTEILVSMDTYNEFVEPIIDGYLEDLEGTKKYMSVGEFARALDEYRIAVENQDEEDTVHDLAEGMLYDEYDDSYVDDMLDEEKEEIIETNMEKITDFYDELFSYLDDIIDSCKREGYKHIVIEF